MYFIHNDAIKAIAFLYPNLAHGVDYLVLMGVEPGRTNPSIPASDAWIEWWDASEAQPTIEYLKQVFAENDLANWELPPPVVPEVAPPSVPPPPDNSTV